MRRPQAREQADVQLIVLRRWSIDIERGEGVANEGSAKGQSRASQPQLRRERHAEARRGGGEGGVRRLRQELPAHRGAHRARGAGASGARGGDQGEGDGRTEFRRRRRDEFGSRGLSAVREVIRGLDGAAEPRGTCARGTAAVLVVRVAVRRELTGLELVFKRMQM